jgi:molybdopterin synthase catalytic subunit
MKMHIELTHQPIILPNVHPSGLDVGAQIDFQGIVREREEDNSIAGLHYEAHEPMARLMLGRILSELALKHPCEEVWITIVWILSRSARWLC